MIKPIASIPISTSWHLMRESCHFDSAYEDYKITPNTSKISEHPIVNNKYFKAMLESRFIEDKIDKEESMMDNSKRRNWI